MAQKLKRLRELLAYGFTYLRQEGLARTWKRGVGFVRRRLKSKRGRYLPTRQVLAAQRQFCADGRAEGWPKISVLVPLFNTPDRFLDELIQSLLGQTYPNWELCLADASTTQAARVAARLARYTDPRIRVQRIENRDIAANTNAAAAMATGSWLALLDHDDVLSPNALYEVAKAAVSQPCPFLYSDEALFTGDITRPTAGHFKPDYSPDYLLSCNYICHLAAFRADLYRELGGERSVCSGSQDHDLFLRLCERTGGAYHIPKVLYYWRVSAASTAGGVQAKPYVEQAALRALNDHLARTGVDAHAEKGKFPSTYHVVYALPQPLPLVSILIPNKDHTDDLEKALQSLYEKTDYPRFEVLVLENNSTDPQTFAYYRQAEKRYAGLRVLNWQGPFNFSAINNFGRSQAAGDYLLLLNNDVQVLNAGWLRELVAQGSQPGVGAVGALLYYPDNTVQHAGVIIGLGGFAGHSHKYARRGASGYMFRQAVVSDLSAVTAACMLVPAAVYDAVGGLDEGFAVAYNDVDFCLRIRQAGYRIVFTPYAELYHYESKSRGLDVRGAARQRFAQEQQRLQQRFGRETLLHDPYYNRNLTLDTEDFAETAVFARD